MDKERIILIGGSAGSLQVLIAIIRSLPQNFSIPIVLVLHRQRQAVSEMKQVLNTFNDKQVLEPDDKSPISNCCFYLAPQNYHLLIEADRTFSLDYSEPVRYSRPSIDVSFESAAMVYASGTTAIILSGANNDGAEGMQAVLAAGGNAIVQNPATAEFPMMPTAAIYANPTALVMDQNEIATFLNRLTTQHA